MPAEFENLSALQALTISLSYYPYSLYILENQGTQISGMDTHNPGRVELLCHHLMRNICVRTALFYKHVLGR